MAPAVVLQRGGLRSLEHAAWAGVDSPNGRVLDTSALPQTGVESISERIPQEVEAKDGEHYGHARKHR